MPLRFISTGQSYDLHESTPEQVLASSHAFADVCEPLEVTLLSGEHRILIEVGDHGRADRIETACLTSPCSHCGPAGCSRIRNCHSMSNSTSARSPFWLTDRLGLTSHPADSVGRAEWETVKHPSPSTYPEMYDPRSAWPCQEPASCPSHRFAMPRLYVAAVTRTGASPQGISRYGAIPPERQRLPTALPAGCRLVLGSRQPGRDSPL